MANASDGSHARIGYALGRSLRSHPIRLLAVLVSVGVLWYAPKFVQSWRIQTRPIAPRRSASVSSSADSTYGGNVNVQRQEAEKRIEVGQAQAFTPDQRRELAQMLGENFRKQDLEISVVAAGLNNDTLILSSDLFKDSASRTTLMRQLRKQWEDLLCTEGFKTVSLTESGVFSTLHDFALVCPKTADERAALAAGLQSDFPSFDNGAGVFASGTRNEVLSMVMTSDAYKAPGNRAVFFQTLKQRGLVRNFCAEGFKEVRLYYLTKETKPSRFPLNCSSTD